MRHHNKSAKNNEKKNNSNACCRYVVADGSDAHRATQSIFFVILNQFLKLKKIYFKAFGVSQTKNHGIVVGGGGGSCCCCCWWWLLLFLLLLLLPLQFCASRVFESLKKKPRKCIFFYTWETEDHGISDVFSFWWEEVRYLQLFLRSTEQKHWYLHSFGHVARNDFPCKSQKPL